MMDIKRTLRILLKLMAITGFVFVAYVFFAAWLTDDAGDEHVIIDISAVEPGALTYYAVPSGKLMVLKRTDEMIRMLMEVQENEYAFVAEQNLATDMIPLFRSRDKGLFVAYGIDPFYRCDIELDEYAFRSVCVEVKYDLAGRVYKGRNAQGNLIVPEYDILPSGHIRLVVK